MDALQPQQHVPKAVSYTHLDVYKRQVVFEDALHAIRTAKAAGFRVAGVYEATAEQDQPEIQRLCDYYIRSYEELVQSETF